MELVGQLATRQIRNSAMFLKIGSFETLLVLSIYRGAVKSLARPGRKQANVSENDTIYLLTAIGLSPGGSITVHIYTQTVHRTTQMTTNLEECGSCPVNNEERSTILED